jgi:hypothetical protein
MARQKTKLCPSCQQVFRGRKDAKTCSDRCRKRLQRAKDLLIHDSGDYDLVPANLVRAKNLTLAKQAIEADISKARELML